MFFDQVLSKKQMLHHVHHKSMDTVHQSTEEKFSFHFFLVNVCLTYDNLLSIISWSVCDDS